MVQEQKEEYDEVLEREEELKNQMKEAKRESESFEIDSDENLPLNYRTYMTSLLKGKIVDLDYSRTKLFLEVDTKEGQLNIPVEDSGEYSEDNELVRLLEWKNIQDGQIGDLIGRDVTIQLPFGVLDRDVNLNDIDCSVYVPKKLDTVGKSVFYLDAAMRRIGITDVESMISKSDDLFLKTLGTMLFFCIVAIVYLVSVLITIPIAAVSGSDSLMVLLPILMTVFVGLELRVLSDILRRY